MRLLAPFLNATYKEMGTLTLAHGDGPAIARPRVANSTAEHPTIGYQYKYEALLSIHCTQYRTYMFIILRCSTTATTVQYPNALLIVTRPPHLSGTRRGLTYTAPKHTFRFTSKRSLRSTYDPKASAKHSINSTVFIVTVASTPTSVLRTRQQPHVLLSVLQTTETMHIPQKQQKSHCRRHASAVCGY